MACAQKLAAEGKARPRTCEECGLGPCKYRPVLTEREAEKQRVINEKADLDGRIERLAERIQELNPARDGAELGLMSEQLGFMRAYSTTLRRRIEAWK
jgi:hypothetical protein